jgi:ribosome maturation factor RimP
MGSRDRELFELLEPIVVAQGVGLVEVRLMGGAGRPVLRVVIHSAAGVSHGDCARVTRAVGDALEDDRVLAGSYRLEVSSPGLRRRLNDESEFELFRGYPVRVWIEEGEATREIAGISQGTRKGEGVVLREQDGTESVIPWSQVTKARLDMDVAPAKGPGGTGR